MASSLRTHVVKISDEGYYSKFHRWQPVSINKATWLTRSQAESCVWRMKKCGYRFAYAELLEKPQLPTTRKE